MAKGTNECIPQLLNNIRLCADMLSYNNNNVHLSCAQQRPEHSHAHMIFYTHLEHSPTKTIHIKYYMESHTHTHTHAHTHTHTYTRTHACTRTHAHTHTAQKQQRKTK